MRHRTRKNSVRRGCSSAGCRHECDRLLLCSVDNMHKYTIELTAENDQVVHERNRYTLRQFFNVDSSASVCYLIIAAAVAAVVVVVLSSSSSSSSHVLVACRSSETLVFPTLYVL